jgi:hypothetical protein
MKGNFLVILLGLVFCLNVFLIKSKPMHAKEWSDSQKKLRPSTGSSAISS